MLLETLVVASLEKVMYVVHAAATDTTSMIALSQITDILVPIDPLVRRAVPRRLHVSRIPAPCHQRPDKKSLRIIASECWFCLSNPNVAYDLFEPLTFHSVHRLSFPSSKHLIVAIGEECYVALPKGQIIPTQSAAERVDVPGGGHVLIVPITHYPTLLSIPPDQSPPVLEETEKCVTALVADHRID